MFDYEDGFFKTRCNSAEARFWKLKIHEEVDRRQTKSSIGFDGNDGYVDKKDGDKSPSCSRSKSQEPVTSNNAKDYQYSYTPAQAD